MLAQPPSGGCVLKLTGQNVIIVIDHQPPSGGCVLKLMNIDLSVQIKRQPPSGGCVLKPSSPKHR